MNAAVELPGETPLERAKCALRRVANYVAFRADLDALILYDTRGNSEETYWRHLWIYLARTALDIPEADIARALDVHHDTVANACHHIEDVLTADAAATYVEEMGAHIIKCWVEDRAFRAALDKARNELKGQRKKDRREAARLHAQD